jgi:GntR family transcriptional regulator, transcriptional repressor for pyruvate dehydrogenase complex
MNNRSLPLQTVRRQKLSDEIVRQLENLILNNELSVGDALPPERDLAVQLGVSRNILREAISTMVQKGLLEVRQGSGTFVASPSVELLRDSLSFFVRFTDSGLFDLLEARFALEVQIAELAARRSTAEDVSLILACYDELDLSVHNPDRYIEADIRFHAALARAAKNEILLLLLDSIRGAMRENVRVLVTHHPHAVEDAMYYHQRITQAIQQGSAADARENMRLHLESVRLGLHELESIPFDPEK